MNRLTKVCCCCHKRKPLSSYHYAAKSPDLRQYQCKSCRREYDRSRRVAVSVTESVVTQLMRGWRSVRVDIVDSVPEAQAG